MNTDVSGTGATATIGPGRRVAVFGAGPGGMTAAHELAERGFEVDLYERHDVVGGKARSYQLPGTGTDGRAGLSGEMGPHGVFGGYQHLGETLGRIPIGDGRTVLDNLTVGNAESRFTMGWDGTVLDMASPRRSNLGEFLKPHTLGNLLTAARKFHGKIGLRDEAVLLSKWVALVTSGERRLWGQLEDVSVEDYFRAAELSPGGYEMVIQMLQANTEPPANCSARAFATSMVRAATVALVSRGTGLDKYWASIFNGPYDEAFFDPWAALLRNLGARIHTGHWLTSLSCENGRIIGATIRDADGTETRVEADYYVLALPPDKAADLMNDDIVAADPALGRIALIEETWLGAVQIYLKVKQPSMGMMGMTFGQPWSIGWIANESAWDRDYQAEYGDGSVVAHISVDMATWDRPGVLYGKPAKQCTPEEIYEEIRAQVRLDWGDATLLADADVHSWFLNPSLSTAADGTLANDEPEFATTPGSWKNQPDAVTEIPNLFLSASYVRTLMGFDSMECANEAGKRAANGVLTAAGSTAKPAPVVPFAAPPALKPLWALDDLMYRLGLPNAFDVIAPYRGKRSTPNDSELDSSPIAKSRSSSITKTQPRTQKQNGAPRQRARAGSV